MRPPKGFGCAVEPLRVALVCACGHAVSAISTPSAVQSMADHIVAVHGCVRGSAL